jgi:uncharacterized protein YbjT (DUF2867 family)
MDTAKSEIPLSTDNVRLTALVLSLTPESLQEVFAGVCDVLQVYQAELQRGLPHGLIAVSLTCGRAAAAVVMNAERQCGGVRHPVDRDILANLPDSPSMQRALGKFRRIVRRAIAARERSWLDVCKYALEPAWYCAEMLRALSPAGLTPATVDAYRNTVEDFRDNLHTLIPAQWFEQWEAARCSDQQVTAEQDAAPKDRAEETAPRRLKDPSNKGTGNPVKRRARAPSTGMCQGVVGDVFQASVSERSVPAGETSCL